MSPSKKLLVFDTTARTKLSVPRQWSDSLPMVKALPGKDDAAGLIELTDGGLRRVLKVDAFSVPFTKQEAETIALAFQSLISCLEKNCALQILVINRPLDAEDYLSQYINASASDNEYLKWYADYIGKWFRRVCEVVAVPRKEFYIIASVSGAKQNPLTKLDKQIKKISKVLKQNNLQSSVLSRSELRKFLYSCLKPSYPHGLKAEPAETLSSSTFPKVAGERHKKNIIIDGTPIHSMVISDLPAKLTLGWMDFVTFSYPSSLSVHIRRADKEHCVELSTYLSTFVNSKQEQAAQLEYQANNAREIFTRQNALLAASSDQFSTWTSTLPLGIDSGGIAHTISIEDAGFICPLFTGAAGTKSGFPLGFARVSNEPVLFQPSHGSIVYGLASKLSDLKFFHSFMSIRMLTANYRTLYLDDGSNSISFLEETLGPAVFRKTSFNEFVSVDEQTAFTSVATGEIATAKHAQLLREIITRWIETHRSNTTPLALFISDLSKFKDSNHSISTLNFILQQAHAGKITLIATALTSKMQSKTISAMLQEHADTTVILPVAPGERKTIQSLLDLDEGDVSAIKSLTKWRNDRDVPCLLKTANSRRVVRILPSPMDYWLCSDHQRDGTKKIHSIKKEIKEKNPKLSTTDTARQAIYYLGIRE